MRPECPGGALDLSHVFLVFQSGTLAVQPVYIYCQLFPEGRGSCRLAVGQAQKRHAGVLFGCSVELSDNTFESRGPYGGYSLFDAEGIGQVIDIFAGACKMYQRLKPRQCGLVPKPFFCSIKAAAYIIFDCFYIVVCNGFDFSQFPDAVRSKLLGDTPEIAYFLCGEGINSGDSRGAVIIMRTISQLDHPLDLYSYPLTVECGLAQILKQWFCLLMIASVQGA